MLQTEQVETLLRMIGRMDRTTLAKKLAEIRTSFPVDFTPEFIETTDLDRLRHIYVALCLQSRQMPGDAESAAA